MSLIQANALKIPLADESAQCVVTSPPYWGLRDYGIGGQLGLEVTPEEYVANMVTVFREVRRVLRDDGVLWLNLGDSYAGSGGPGSQYDNKATSGYKGEFRKYDNPNQNVIGLKPKDLCGIPWRVAFALQADGWWLRSDCIWAKPNPMPESCKDRPTKSHEYIFLLTKSAYYFYDQEAVRESYAEASLPRAMRGLSEDNKWSDGAPGSTAHSISQARPNAKLKDSGQAFGGDGHKGYIDANGRLLINPAGRNLRTVWNIATAPLNSVVSYGRCRIASPDCPVHDYQADLELVLEYDAQLDVSDFVRNLDKYNRLSVKQEGVAVSIPLYQFGSLLDETFAIPHNKRSYRTEDELKRDVIFFGISADHIEYKKLLDHCVAKFCHNHASSIWAGALLDEPYFDPSAQKIYRIVGIATFETPPNGCNCYYTGTVEKRQDHFASFPPVLVARCIKAGSSERGCCPVCGKPWERIVEKEFMATSAGGRKNITGQDFMQGWEGVPRGNIKTNTLGWRPICNHDSDPVPCTIFDPFVGSGTTVMVAKQLGRRGIGIDLSLPYLHLARERTGSAALEEWIEGKKNGKETDMDDLPMFKK